MLIMRTTIRRTILFLFGLVVVAGLFAVSPVWSMENRFGEEVVIAADEVINDDLYVSARTITIDGTLKGDLIASGHQITVNGTVEQDLIAAGQGIVINGKVNDDVRIAGQVLQLGSKAQIGDDFVAAGYSLESKAGSNVAGDLSFAGAQALIAGNIKEDIIGAMNALELRGMVDGNVNVTVGSGDDIVEPFDLPFLPPLPIEAPQLRTGLTVADSAKIGGELRYKSASDGNISPSAEIERQIRESIKEFQRPSPTTVAIATIQRWLTLLVVGLVLLWGVPNWTQRLANTVQSQPLPSLGWGFVSWLVVGVLGIAIPMATIILTMILGFTISGLIPLVFGIGFLANLTLFASFLLYIGYIPQVVVSLLGGQWLLQKTQSNWASSRFAPLVIGLIIFVILAAIPVLGLLVNLIAILMGLGALWIWGRTRLSDSISDRKLATV